MNSLLLYIIQVMICSGLLYLYYYAFLRNRKFHRYNRFYLVGIAIISLALPYFDFTIYVSSESQTAPFVWQTLSGLTDPGPAPKFYSTPNEAELQGINFLMLAYIFYILVILVGLTRLLLSFRFVTRLHNQSEKKKVDNIQLIFTDEPTAPFSFFRWLFWNRSIELNSEKGEQVFRHELFHIRQRHSWDRLFIETLSTICWINPFFHLIKRELKAVHEFLADEAAVVKNKEWQYAELLLTQALRTNNSLVNPFFHNQIKRRIAMITLSSKPSHRYLRKILVLPLLTLLAIIFSFAYRDRQPDKSPTNQVTAGSVPQDTIPRKKQIFHSIPDKFVLEADSIIIREKCDITYLDALLIIDGKKYDASFMLNKSLISKKVTFYPRNYPETMRLYGDAAKNGVIELEGTVIIDQPPTVRHSDLMELAFKSIPDNKVFIETEINASFPGGENAWQNFIIQKTDLTAIKVDPGKKAIYRSVIQFDVDRSGIVHSIKPLTNYGLGMEKEMIRVFKSSPAWKPAIQNGKVVSARYFQPIVFTIGSPNEKGLPVIDKQELPYKNPMKAVLISIGDGSKEQ